MRFHNILLVYKMSTYKYRIRRGHSSKVLASYSRHDNRFKRAHIQHYKTLKNVEKYLKEKHVPYAKIWRGKTIDFKPFDLIITVGGDGTFLEAARQITRQMILGINSDPLWSVGRFCIANSKNYKDAFKHIHDDDFKIVHLHRLKLKLHLGRKSFLVLNDILITNNNPAAMSRYFISSKNFREEQRSSGIWISSAAGSTGAIHSAGGKILPFRSQQWQYKPRELYYCRRAKYCLKGSILRPSERLSIQSRMNDGYIYIDGAHKKIRFPFGEKAVISNAHQPLNFLMI